MSEPTYRIEVVHDTATATRYRYDWIVYRVSDDQRMSSGWATTTDEAIEQAQDSIKRGYADEGTISVYATEDGEITEPPVPQSLRA